MSFLPFRSLP